MRGNFKIILNIIALLIIPITLYAHVTEPIKVACIGNSITYGHGIEKRFQNSYPGILQQMLGPGYDVRNYGKSYCTTLQKGDCPYMHQEIWKDVQRFLPNIVTIKLGTNDSKFSNWKHGKNFGHDLSELISQLKSLSSNPTIYLCHPIPSLTSPFEKGINDSILFHHIIPVIDSVATVEGLEIIDLYTPMLSHMDCLEDRLHPNATGSAVIASEIFKKLTKSSAPAYNTEQIFPGKKTIWFEHDRYDFIFKGKQAIVVVPKKMAPGRPWIWRPAFFGAFPSVDKTLLEKGFHIVYLDLTDEFACPESIDCGIEFHSLMTNVYGLSNKVTLEGFSRGGYYVLNWAAVCPDKVANIYVDAPVCDINSWPGKRDAFQWKIFEEKWKIIDKKEVGDNFVGNVLQHVEALSDIPIIAVCGGQDTVVPYSENFEPVKKALDSLGASVQVIIKEHGNHHPHSLEYPDSIVNFIINKTNALPHQPRIVLNLRKWKFHFGDCMGAELSTFNDASWNRVTVPHDWAIKRAFDMNIDKQIVMVKEDCEIEPQLRTGRTGALPCYGVGWYRVTIPKDPAMSGKKVRLEIDGAMSNATVFVNGIKVGGRPYGYTSYALNLSSVWNYNENNVIAIRLNNEEKSSRWYPGAGIYRNVRLLFLEDTHVNYCGTYVRTFKDVVNIETKLNHPASVYLHTEILDALGQVVGSSNGKPDKYGVCNQKIHVPNPQNWSPEHPYCYSVRTIVMNKKSVLDEYTTRFGFRTIEFNSNEGFKLNGVKTTFKGVCMHHDLGPLGAAINFSALHRQLEILKDMGCNAIRTSHNPPAPELVKLCDEMGFMLMVEAFDEWKRGKNSNSYYKYFDEWAEKDLKSMILQYRNSPSVVMWSIGNELGEQDHPDGWKVAKMLTAYVKELDVTRPVTAGFNSYPNAVKNALTDEVDLVGFNYRPFAYAKVHKTHPNYILFGSETASTVSSRGVYKFPVTERKSPMYDDYQVSSYDLEFPAWASTPDTEFEQQDINNYVMGEFVWTGFDYLGEPTPYNEGTSAKSSYFGIVDLAGLPKDRFYLYRSRWNEQEPTLHLLPHWTWPGMEGKQIPIHCYTSYNTAELFVNGKSYGRISKTLTKSKYNRYRLIWEDVIYEPGELKVVAYNEAGQKIDEEIINTSGRPYAIKLIPNTRKIDVDSDQLCFIEVQIVDSEGNLCPTAANMLFFDVEGCGKLRALCNGDPTDQTAFSSNYMKVFNGKLVAILEGISKVSKIKLKVISSTLKPASLTLWCK